MMRIGWNSIGAGSLDATIADAQQAEAEGFAAYSMANIFGHDAITTLAIVGTQTSSIELLTAVVPTYPRHPAAIAQQAVTAQAASKGRFTLGIGLSHEVVIHGMYGMSYDRPAAHMREYLAILMPLLRGEPVRFKGEQLTFRGAIQVDGAKPVPCAIAALGPAMLKLAGEQTAGSILWMTNAKAISTHSAPRLRKAAAEAGRPEPQIIASLPIALTNDVEGAREAATKQFQVYGNLPSYRSMLDTGGAVSPGDAAIVGDEAALDRQLRELEEAGVTLFTTSVFPADEGSVERTRAFMAARASAGA
jgi:F420-dependent oxidoreductase-like protein